MTNSRSPARSRTGSEQRRRCEAGRRDEGEERRDRESLAPTGPRSRPPRSIVKPERDEDDDLGERGEPFLEHLDLALERRLDVADEQAGDEHREEAGAVRDVATP